MGMTRETETIMPVSPGTRIFSGSAPDVCGEEATRCQCVLPPMHEPPHSCDCGGSWVGEIGTDTFRVVTYPEVGALLGWAVPAVDALAAAGLLEGGVRRGGIRYEVPDA